MQPPMQHTRFPVMLQLWQVEIDLLDGLDVEAVFFTQFRQMLNGVILLEGQYGISSLWEEIKCQQLARHQYLHPVCLFVNVHVCVYSAKLKYCIIYSIEVSFATIMCIMEKTNILLGTCKLCKQICCCCLHAKFKGCKRMSKRGRKCCYDKADANELVQALAMLFTSADMFDDFKCFCPFSWRERMTNLSYRQRILGRSRLEGRG